MKNGLCVSKFDLKKVMTFPSCSNDLPIKRVRYTVMVI